MRFFMLVFSIVVIFSVGLRAQADYTKADSVAALYPNYSLKDLKSLANKLTKPLSTDVEKFRAIL
jgi:hypothetical protein